MKSLTLIMHSLGKFSGASGLQANFDNSALYCSGVSEELRIELEALLGMNRGELPFRYLGVPLATRKLPIRQCKPLLDRILARLQSWTVHILAYSGRLVLIKSIIEGMMAFWAQVFILPKKLIKEVDRACRVFMWVGKTGPSKKALVAWEEVCKPIMAGGLGLKTTKLWNKAALVK